MKNFNKRILLVVLIIAITVSAVAIASDNKKPTKTANFAYKMYIAQGGV